MSEVSSWETSAVPDDVESFLRSVTVSADEISDDRIVVIEFSVTTTANPARTRR